MARANWHHHVARELADSAGTVVIEKLNVKAMTASAKGTAKAPGKNVSVKAALNRRILETGWAGLGAKIGYKAASLIEGRSGLHESDLPCVRACGQRKPPLAKRVRMRGLRPPRQRGCERRVEHTGPGDWGCWTWRWRRQAACETSTRCAERYRERGGVKYISPRAEWQRTSLPFSKANEACGVANAASRKYLSADHNWYFPPEDHFERLVAYANRHGDPAGRPFFSLDGQAFSGTFRLDSLAGQIPV